MSGNAASQLASGSSSNVGTLPPDLRYRPGETIADKYRLIERLGQGGMGAIWMARNLALDVLVAIKLVRADLDSSEAGQRLWTEARATAQLTHPAIVRVYDFGRTERGDPYIAMELLAGESLGDRLERQGRMHPVAAVQLLLPIVEALVTVHSKRVVHRDLKPDNIFLTELNGRIRPKLLDFGVAQYETAMLAMPRLTQMGHAVGSPDYMAPEQARGEPELDERVDVWGISVVLYEAVTGRVPFHDVPDDAVLTAILERPIPNISQHGIAQPELWTILQRGLAKDRTERWATMQELGEALAAWLRTQGVREDACGQALECAWPAVHVSAAREVSGLRPRSRRSRRGVLLFAGASLVVALGAGAAANMKRSEPARLVPALQIRQSSMTTLFAVPNAPVEPSTPAASEPVVTPTAPAQGSPPASAAPPAATVKSINTARPPAPATAAPAPRVYEDFGF